MTRPPNYRRHNAAILSAMTRPPTGARHAHPWTVDRAVRDITPSAKYWRVTPMPPRTAGMTSFTIPGEHDEAMRQATKWAQQIRRRVRVTLEGRA